MLLSPHPFKDSGKPVQHGSLKIVSFTNVHDTRFKCDSFFETRSNVHDSRFKCDSFFWDSFEKMSLWETSPTGLDKNRLINKRTRY